MGLIRFDGACEVYGLIGFIGFMGFRFGWRLFADWVQR